MHYSKVIKKTSIIFIVFYILLISHVSAVSVKAADASELANQGKVRTCLKAQWNNLPDKGGSMRRATIQLTGRCESPGGCDCVLYQHLNGAVALDAEGGLDDLCAERALLENPESIKRLARVLGVSTSLLAKWAPKPEMSAEEKAIRNKKLRNRCQKNIREANDETLGSIIPGSRRCNIVKNNLASAGSSVGKGNVLGVTSDGKIPYGNVDIIVEEDAYKHSPVEFSAQGQNTANDSGSTTDINLAGAGGDKTLKNALLSFLKQEVKTTITDLTKNCTGITWDPYGRVFDAQSLEPIPDVLVDLMDATTKQSVVMKQNLSYDVTGDDGLYNIQVERVGGYTLEADSLTQHVFVQNPSLNPLWKYIYSDLYTKDTVFQEKYNTPSHLDIALDPIDLPFTDAVAKIVPGTLTAQELSGVILYKGRSTFPMSLTCLVNANTGEQVGECVHANNIGGFAISLPKDKVPMARLKVVVQKVNLNDPKLYSADANVETLHLNSIMLPDNQKAFYFEPILAMVEGYAYGPDKKIIPNAVVKVVEKESKKLYYQTKADATGYFAIYADKLPYYEYYLEITPLRGVASIQTTSEFVSLNTAYLEKSKTNLLLAQINTIPVTKKSTASQYIPEQPSADLPQTKAQLAPQSMQVFLLVGVLAFLLIMGVVAYVMVRKQ